MLTSVCTLILLFYSECDVQISKSQVQPRAQSIEVATCCNLISIDFVIGKALICVGFLVRNKVEILPMLIELNSSL